MPHVIAKPVFSSYDLKIFGTVDATGNEREVLDAFHELHTHEVHLLCEN